MLAALLAQVSLSFRAQVLLRVFVVRGPNGRRRLQRRRRRGGPVFSIGAWLAWLELDEGSFWHAVAERLILASARRQIK